MRAFAVLGGDGWTLPDYFTSAKLAEHLIHAALIRVVILEAFIQPRKQPAALIVLAFTLSVFALTPGQSAASRPPP